MVDYILKRSQRKTLSITMQNGRAVVNAPFTAPKEYIDSFVISKENWILKKEANYKKLAGKLEKYFDYSEVLIENTGFPLISSKTLKNFYLSDKAVYYPSRFSGSINDNAAFQRAFLKWYKKLASERLYSRLIDASVETDIRFAGFSITNAKSKWGSCDSKKQISLNWRLFMMPEKIADYVVIHELCHIIEPNHSKKFWALVAKYCPDYKNYQKELKNRSILNNLFR